MVPLNLENEKIIGAYIQGFIGYILVAVGVFGCLFGGLMFAYADQLNVHLILVSFTIMFFGGYMAFLSKQTVRVADLNRDSGEDGGTHKRGKVRSIAFKGDRDIASDEYQLYLVEKYNIEKNETLNKFVFGKKLFATIDAALNAAHLEDRESQVKTGDPNLTENQAEWYSKLVALEFGQSIIIDGDKITKMGELFGGGSYYFCGSIRYRTAKEVIAEYKIK